MFAVISWKPLTVFLRMGVQWVCTYNALVRTFSPPPCGLWRAVSLPTIVLFFVFLFIFINTRVLHSCACFSPGGCFLRGACLWNDWRRLSPAVPAPGACWCHSPWVFVHCRCSGEKGRSLELCACARTKLASLEPTACIASDMSG